MIRRTKAADRLARLEASAPPPKTDLAFEIPADLSALSDDDLQDLCERFLATVDLTPEDLAMTDEELDEHCCRLVKEDQMRAGLFD